MTTTEPTTERTSVEATASAEIAPAADRVARFRAELAELNVPAPTPGRDRRLLAVGVALLVVGVVLEGVAYNLSHSTDNPLQQNDAVVVALSGVAVTIVGGFVFLRYSLSGFLRFWLARALFDQRERDERRG